MMINILKRFFGFAILALFIMFAPHSDAQTWKKITPDSGSGGSGGTTNVNNEVLAPSCYYTNGACGTGFSGMPGAYEGYSICCSSASGGGSPSFADTNPIPFDIPNDSAYPNSMVLAPIVQISGISEADLSITSNGTAAYRLCADSSCTDVTNNWGTSTVTVADGQYFQVRAQAPSTSGQITLSTLTIGEFTDEWSILVTGDTTPNAFDIRHATKVPTNVYTSIIQQVTGIDEAVIDVSGETVEYRTCSDAACSTVIEDWTESQSVINNNNYYQIRQTAGSDEETRTGTLEIGTLDDDWNLYSTNDFITFVTDAKWDGDLGGVTGADAKCAAVATDYNNFPSGTYRAWISTPGSDLVSRFESVGTTKSYRLPNLPIIANNWSDLTDSSIDGVISTSDDFETGIYEQYVWTGSMPDGTHYQWGTYDNCSNFTSGVNSVTSNQAVVGRITTDVSWARYTVRPCNTIAPMYCFQTTQ